MLLIILIEISLICAENYVQPIHYELQLEPDFPDLITNGRAIISIDIHNRIDKIQLKHHNLNVSSLKCLKTGAEIPCNYQLDAETVVVVADLQIGRYQLVVDYRGAINEESHGLFRVEYRKTTGDQGVVILSDLQQNHAREVFPSFDPQFRATFNVSIVRPDNFVALFNTKLARQTVIGDGRVIDNFEITEPISAGLLEFAIVDLEKISGKSCDIYSYTSENLDFFLEVTEESIPILNSLINGSSIRVNQLILPDDCLSQTTGNGLIVYRESDVAYNAGCNTTGEKQQILKRIVNNLAKILSLEVYLPTSSRYWISDGLTISYKYQVVSGIVPNWRLDEQFVVEDIHLMLETDFGDTALSLDYGSKFDRRYPTKAGILLRMLLNQNLSLDDILNHPLADIWGGNRGYPLVTLLRDYEFSATLQQTEFGSVNSTIWQVPVDLRTKDGIIGTVEMISVNATITGRLSAKSWVLINDEEYNYFRANYDEKNWYMLVDFLRSGNFKSLSPINRAQLIDNTANLLQFGYISSDLYLDLISYISREDDFIPLLTFFRTTTKIKSLLSRTETQAKFMAFVRGLVVNLYNHYGPTIKPSESHIERLNRIQIVNWMCNFHHQPCLDAMNKLLSSYQINHPDLEESVYCGGMKSGKLVDFLWLSTQFKRTKKARILHGMGCTDDQQILTLYTQMLMGQSAILELDTSESVRAFSAIYKGSDNGIDLALDLIANHFNKITERFDSNQVDEMIIGLSKHLVLPDSVNKIDGIISTIGGDYLGIFQKARNLVVGNIEWRDSNLESFDKWLDQYEQTTESSTIRLTSTPIATSDITAISTIKPTPASPNIGVTILAFKTVLFVSILGLLVC